MALVTIPTVYANAGSMRLVRKDVALETMSGAEVYVAPPGTKWAAHFTLKPQSLVEARVWQSALVQLSKLGNYMELPVTAMQWSNGAGYTGANPLVAGANQLGLDLACDGASASQTVALEGDFIAFNSELKLLTANATSNALGAVTFNFEPAIRSAPLDNAEVNVKTPKLKCRLMDPQAAWSIALADVYGMQVEVIEVY